MTLDRVRDCQGQRLSSVTDQQKEARLLRMRDRQNIQRQGTERGQAATDDGLLQSEVNFCKDLHRRPYIPLFDQPAVREKMLKFHSVSTVQDALLVWSSFLV